MSIETSPATTSTTNNVSTVEVLYTYESRTARGHSVCVQPGERYALINDANDDWWFVCKEQFMLVDDGFYLPRTFVKKVAPSTSSVSMMTTFRPASMTLPSDRRSQQVLLSSDGTARLVSGTNTSSFRKPSAPGFWLAANPNRISRSIPGDLNITAAEGEIDVDVKDENTDANLPPRPPNKDSTKARTPMRVEPVKLSDEILARQLLDDKKEEIKDAIEITDEQSSSEPDSDEYENDIHDHSPDSAISETNKLDTIPGYENVQILNSLNRRAPEPEKDQKPLRVLHDDWCEYEEMSTGRTYFYHAPSGFSSWKPPRGLITPKQVENILNNVDDNEKDVPTVASIQLQPRHRSTDSGNIIEKMAPQPPSPSHKPRHLVGNNILTQSDTHDANDANRERSITTSVMSASVDSGVAIHLHNRSFRDHKGSNYDPYSCSQQLAQQVNNHSSIRRAPTFDVVTNTAFHHNAIKHGQLDKYKAVENGKKLKKQWITCYVYLTSGHMIFYKDQKSSEKRGQQYPTPLGVCDLRGANICWTDADRKHKHVFLCELADGTSYGFSAPDTQDINSWYHAVRQSIAKLPAPEYYPAPTSTITDKDGVKTKITSANIPAKIKGSPQNPQMSHTPPNDTDDLTRKHQRRSFTLKSQHDEITNMETSLQAHRESREGILERLIRFFRTRPSLDSLKEKGIYKPEPVFGSSLIEICEREKSLIPKFIRRCTEIIEAKGLDADGLYRISGNLSQVQKIRCQVDQDKYTLLTNESDIHVITGALKLFFRELQQPVFPPSSHKDFLDAIRIQKPKQRSSEFNDILKRLPPQHYFTIKHLFAHLIRVSEHADTNRMQIHNLAIVFGPTLFSSGSSESRPKASDGKKRKSSDGKGDKNTKWHTPPSSQPSSSSNGAQSNSHLAFNMIMHGQIVEYLLKEYERFFPPDTVKGSKQHADNDGVQRL